MDEFQIKRTRADDELIFSITETGKVNAQWFAEVSIGAGCVTAQSSTILSKDEVKQLIALLVKSL